MALVAYAQWTERLQVDAQMGNGTLGLTATDDPDFSFTCTPADPCDPDAVTASVTFTNTGSIPVEVLLDWNTSDATHCSFFDVTWAIGAAAPIYSGDLCTLLSDGAKTVTAQLDPAVPPAVTGESVILDITVTPRPADPGWPCDLTMNLTATTSWQQWTGAGWSESGNAQDFVIDVGSKGRILVDKVTSPAADPQGFTFTPSWGADFTLTDTDAPHDSGLLDPGTYSVAETVPPGWTLATATCDDGSPVNAIDLSAGELVTCTFTNTAAVPDTAGLTVVKHVVNTGGGTLSAANWTMTVTGANPAPASFPGSESGTTVRIDPNTAYTVSESSQPGYAATYSTGCSSTAGLAAGASATCTVTNTYVPTQTLSCPGVVSVSLNRLTGAFTVTNLSAGAYNAVRLWGSPAPSQHWGNWANGYPLYTAADYPTGSTPWLNCRGNLAAGASCSGTQPPPHMQYVMVSSGAAGLFQQLCVLDFGVPPTFLSRTTSPITFQLDRMSGHFLVWNIGAANLAGVAIYDNATGAAPWGTAWTQCAGSLAANTICNSQTSPVPVDRYVRVAWTGGEVVFDFGP